MESVTKKCYSWRTCTLNRKCVHARRNHLFTCLCIIFLYIFTHLEFSSFTSYANSVSCRHVYTCARTSLIIIWIRGIMWLVVQCDCCTRECAMSYYWMVFLFCLIPRLGYIGTDYWVYKVARCFSLHCLLFDVCWRISVFIYQTLFCPVCTFLHYGSYFYRQNSWVKY